MKAGEENKINLNLVFRFLLIARGNLNCTLTEVTVLNFTVIISPSCLIGIH